MTEPIRRAGPADCEALSLVVAEAFHDLPPARWLVPDPDERARIFPHYFRLLIEHAVGHGEVHTVSGAAAVGVWFDVTSGLPPVPPGYDRRLAEVCGPWVDRFRVFDRILEHLHPRRPHHYLALLATRPGHQRTGLGTALLEHHHRHLDRYAIPAYLEASSPRSRDLYLRLGYELLPAARLPDGPRLWPMWRRPQLTQPARWPP